MLFTVLPYGVTYPPRLNVQEKNAQHRRRIMGRKNLQDVQHIEFVIEHDRPMASLLQVAKHFGKAHDNVLRDIRNLIQIVPEEWASINFEDINISTELGHATRQDPAYMMTRDGFTLLAMGFTGKKAVDWKLKYIEAFSSMEAALRQQTAGEMRRADIPPLESEEISHSRMVKVLRAMLAYWAYLDQLPLDIAETTFCIHLGVRRLEHCALEDTTKAFTFLFRAMYQPVSTGEAVTKQQLESIRLIGEGCT
jgi:Rha family phage regulatory protein